MLNPDNGAKVKTLTPGHLNGGTDLAFVGSEKSALLDNAATVQSFAPDLVAEVASDRDTFLEFIRKKNRYLAAGCKEVWLISIEELEIDV